MAIAYLWDVPYSDFTSNLKVKVYTSSGTELPDVSYELEHGNITLQLPSYGSYRLVAIDSGIKYAKHITVNAPVVSGTGSGVDMSMLERYVRENSSNLVAVDNKNGTITITVGE